MNKTSNIVTWRQCFVISDLSLENLSPCLATQKCRQKYMHDKAKEMAKKDNILNIRGNLSGKSILLEVPIMDSITAPRVYLFSSFTSLSGFSKLEKHNLLSTLTFIVTQQGNLFLQCVQVSQCVRG